MILRAQVFQVQWLTFLATMLGALLRARRVTSVLSAGYLQAGLGTKADAQARAPRLLQQARAFYELCQTAAIQRPLVDVDKRGLEPLDLGD